MNKKRVVVVDDSAFMRKMIGDMIESFPEFTVVDRLRNGRELVEKIIDLKPDIVTLDVEMPVMDGLSTLKELKIKRVSTKIIMVSSLTSEGSRMTIECLMNGAIDFIQKPSGSISLDIEKIKEDLYQKFLTISSIDIKRVQTRKAIELPKSEELKVRKQASNIKTNKKIEAVLIGSSTGGPRAVQKILTEIKNIDIPIIVVQHMPKGFTKAFADRLNTLCSLNIVEAENGMRLQPNTVYIAKGGYHLEVSRDKTIHLTDGQTLWGVKPAVDKMISTAAASYRGNVLSIILTGMGKDGSQGTVFVKEFGGITMAEDKSTSVVFGMPKAAIDTGKVDYVVPLDEIPNNILSLVKGR